MRTEERGIEVGSALIRTSRETTGGDEEGREAEKVGDMPRFVDGLPSVLSRLLEVVKPLPAGCRAW
jgi:hypothetical protein